MNGFRLSDLQLRNDLLVITTLIAENPNSLLIVSTGHCRELYDGNTLQQIFLRLIAAQYIKNMCLHVSHLQESLFAKQLVDLVTFPEREATFSLYIFKRYF